MSKCAQGAQGPAVLVNVTGFKGEAGKVRVQTYPATSDAWLEKGEWLERVDVPVNVSGSYMRFCMPVPAPGTYGIAVRHDINGNGKTDFTSDGGGFSNNPSINLFNLGKPSAKKVGINVGRGVTTVTIRLRYL